MSPSHTIQAGCVGPRWPVASAHMRWRDSGGRQQDQHAHRKFDSTHHVATERHRQRRQRTARCCQRPLITSRATRSEERNRAEAREWK